MVKRAAPSDASTKTSSKKARVSESSATSIANVTKKAKDAVLAVASDAVSAVTPAVTTGAAKSSDVKDTDGKSKRAATTAPDARSKLKEGKKIAEAKHEEDASGSTGSKKRKTAEDFLDSEPMSKTAVTSIVKKSKTAANKSDVSPTSAADVNPTSAPAATASKPLKSVLKKSILSKPSTSTSTSASSPIRTQPTRTKSKTTLSTSASASAGAGSKAAYIAGFSSSESGGSDDDESDGDDDDVDMDGGKGRGGRSGEDKRRIDVKTLPTIAKDDKTVMRKLEKAKRKNDKQRGVLYLGRIPHGFYEEEMKSYFSQFGDVTRLRLSRNKKTGASKHYAYIEFNSKSVAEITADTMNNYLLMGHILQCHIIPNDEVHPDLFIGANRKYQAPPAALQAMRLKTLKMGDEKVRAKANARLIKRDEKRQEKIKSLGIDYEFKL